MVFVYVSIFGPRVRSLRLLFLAKITVVQPHSHPPEEDVCPDSSPESASSFHLLMGGLLQQVATEKLSQPQLSSIAPISLAYIGDAVFEMYVRSRLLLPAKKIRDYHNQVVGQVKAEQQAHYADFLLPHLSEAEKDILRRGRNATTGRQRRATAQSYQKATGFEALIGFLYLSDQPRLFDLLKRLSI